MELKVYNWEYFERGKVRYIIFAVIILLVIVWSVLAKNAPWWILVLIFAWWYLYYLTKINSFVQMKTWKNALQVGKYTYSRDSLTWFVLEYHTEKKIIHNIVLIENTKEARIYTITDTSENLENFVHELSKYIPMLDTYNQSFFDKFLRKIKL